MEDWKEWIKGNWQLVVIGLILIITGYFLWKREGKLEYQLWVGILTVIVVLGTNYFTSQYYKKQIANT